MEKMNETINKRFIKNREIDLNYKLPEYPKNRTLIFYQDKTKPKSTIQIYKEIMKNDENFKDNIVNPHSKSITANLLLPLIGFDPQTQKKILEDEDNSFKIKLKKLKRFKNKSVNFERIFLNDQKNKLKNNSNHQKNKRMSVKSLQIVDSNNLMKNRNSIKFRNKIQEDHYNLKKVENENDLNLNNIKRNQDNENNEFLKSSKFKRFNLNEILQEEGLNKINDIIPHNSFIPKYYNLSKREKEKHLNSSGKKEEKQIENNQILYANYKNKEVKYNPEVFIYEENPDYLHPCVRGETTFKQYSFRSLDNQIKTKNFLEKEIFNNFDDSTTNNNMNIVLPYQIGSVNLEQKISKGITEFNDKILFDECFNSKKKKYSNLNNMNLDKNKSIYNDYLTKNKILSNYNFNNTINNQTNSNSNFRSKKDEENEFLGYNQHFINFKLKNRNKNNFKKIIKITNNNKNSEKNRDNSDLNFDFSEFKQKKGGELNVKTSYLNEQLNITPRKIIPDEILYLFEKKKQEENEIYSK